MKLGRILLPLLAVLFSTGASKPQLVPDVSQRQIDIRFSFTGEELLLFGAIAYPDGHMPAKAPDIVVVLKGPDQSIRMREKQKVAGIWVNADSMRFQSTPSFYALASTRPIAQITDEKTAAIYELGIDKMQLSPTSFQDEAELKRFQAGLIDLQGRRGLFARQVNTVEVADRILYRARLHLSARALEGTYTAETFLVQDGRVVAAAVRDIVVQKSGFERFVATAARRWSLLYGLCAIAIAVAMGWVAGQIGRRF